MTFEELVDWSAGNILQNLIKGDFRTGVWCAMECAQVWASYEENKLNRKYPKKQKKNKKK